LFAGASKAFLEFGNSMHRFFKLSFVVVCIAVMITGCGFDSDVANVVGESNRSNVQKVANSLALYQTVIGQAAQTEEELCDFIATNSKIAQNLELMKIDRDSFKSNLVSERTGTPFFVRYGVYVVRDGRSPAEPLVFETVGVEGSRRIGWSDASVTDESNAVAYDKLRGKGSLEN